MKLKKIASLMLAGIMAVSMLAACGEGKGNSNSGSSSSEQTASSNFTSAVMNKASKATKDVLAVNSDDTLDKAIAVAAENSSLTFATNGLQLLNSSDSYAQYANKIINDTKWTYASEVTGWEFTDTKHNADGTYWAMYIVSSPKTLDWIAGEIATKLDTMVKTTGMNGKNCEYSVRVATADIDASDVMSGTVSGSTVTLGSYDGYLVGVAITVDNTENNH